MLTFDKVEEKDLDKICEIEKENFRSPFLAKDFRYELNSNPFSYFYCVKEENEISGFIIFWITFETSTLCKIAVQNLKKHTGLGTFLLQNMEKILKEKEVESMTLEVRKSNENAIKFYEKNGFIKLLVKEGYYKDGEDAYYMMKGF